MKRMLLKNTRTIAKRPKLVAALGIVTLSALATVFVLPITAQFAGADHTSPRDAVALAIAAPLKSVGGTANLFDAVDATDNPCTSSTAFVDMPGMTKTFFQGSTDEALVMFTGEWISNTGRAMIRLLIDGVVQAGPGDAASPFAPHEGTGVATNGFNFITNALGVGNHTAKIQWSTTGSQICVDERSIIVMHR